MNAVPERVLTGPRVFICAGEDSGDVHASSLIRQMAQVRPDVRFEGFGGRRMEAAGCHLHANIIHLAAMGFSFLQNVRAFAGLIRRFYRLLREDPPDVLVLVDFPGFNFLLARLAHWNEIPVVYYICPQIWAWAPWRRGKILRLTDLLMVILPFEEDFYRSPGHHVVHVGHPLADALTATPPADVLEDELRARHAIATGARVLGLFPGSREHEVRQLLPYYRDILAKMAIDPGSDRIVVSCCREEFRPIIEETLRDLPVRVDIEEGDAHALMAASDLALVASGTASLELAYYGTPMLVLYRVGRLAHAVFRLLCTSPFISLVNILGGEEVVPEEVTHRDGSEEQARRAELLLRDTPERARCIQRLQDLRERVFQPGASRHAAETLARFLEARRVTTGLPAGGSS